MSVALCDLIASESVKQSCNLMEVLAPSMEDSFALVQDPSVIPELKSCRDFFGGPMSIDGVDMMAKWGLQYLSPFSLML